MSPFGQITISILPHHLHSLKFIWVSNIVGNNGYCGNQERHLIDSRCWMSEEFVLHLIKHDSREYEWNPWRINQIIVWVWCRWQFLTFFPGDYPDNFQPDWTNTGWWQGRGRINIVKKEAELWSSVARPLYISISNTNLAMGDLRMVPYDTSDWIKFSKRCSHR